jgi:hypothetical protein
MITTAVSLSTCRYCGAIHTLEMCPKIREIEYYQDGSVKRVSLMRPVDYIARDPSKIKYT